MIDGFMDIRPNVRWIHDGLFKFSLDTCVLSKGPS
jgi:hypothetical protein